VSESWGERVGVTLWYEDPEYEDDEGIFRALAMSGTPEGVTIEGTGTRAEEALERLSRALATFGYRGPVLVQDATVRGGDKIEFRVEG
jgi:hypothetical protein